MITSFEVAGGDFTRAGFASSQVKKMLKNLAVDPVTIKRVVVALYEAEVNIVAHAFRGDINVDIGEDYIKMVLDDEGPGIANIEQAMVKGYSTASPAVQQMGFGAGMGLPNIRDNADEFTIDSRVGVGTILTIKINL